MMSLSILRHRVYFPKRRSVVVERDVHFDKDAVADILCSRISAQNRYRRRTC